MAFQEIPAGDFKAHCLRLMDEVQAKRRPLVITKRGKPVAKLVPIDDDSQPQSLFGAMAGTVTIKGDIMAPIDEAWEADG